MAPTWGIPHTHATPAPAGNQAHAGRAFQDQWLELYGFLTAAASDSAAAWHVAPLQDTCELRLLTLAPGLEAERCAPFALPSRPPDALGPEQSLLTAC